MGRSSQFPYVIADVEERTSCSCFLVLPGCVGGTVRSQFLKELLRDLLVVRRALDDGAGNFSARMYAELREHTLGMMSRGVWADVQLGCNCRVACAAGQVKRDVRLAPRHGKALHQA